jgi:GMP reductase
MRIETEVKLDFSDVLICPKRSTLTSRKEVTLIRDFTFRHSPHGLRCVPVMASNMDTSGTFEVANVLNRYDMLTCLHKFYTIEDYASQSLSSNMVVTTGTSDEDFAKLGQVMARFGNTLSVICVDVANGYTEMFMSFIKRVRATYPEKVLIAGNVVTGDMTQELILAGADIVKVGIGPGSACTTRMMTGVGYPQLSAIIECADAAHGLGGHIIADGGCREPGDVAKAFAGGADFVMLGGMFAGHDESGGELIEEEGKKYKLFYGMSSDTAMKKYYGGVAEYRASEGATMKVAYKGAIEETVKSVLGGLRSTCTYVGASTLKHLTKRTTFVRKYR